MKVISFLLNLPYTALGALFAVFLFPKKISWNKEYWALIFVVRGNWPQFGYLKKWRGATVGHAIILNPQSEEGILEHELVHIRQYHKYPFIFPFLYEIEFLRRGYKDNRFEKEAYSQAKNN